MKIDAKLKKRLMTAGSVFAIALGTGFVMQKVGPMADDLIGGEAEQQANAPADKAKAIQPLSSAPLKRASAAPQSGPAAPAVASEPATPEVSVPKAPSPEANVGVMRSASLLPMPALHSTRTPEAAAAQAEAPTSMPASTSAEATPAPAQKCALKLSAKARPAAMVRLTLAAPCNPGEPVTLKHGALTFTEMTDNTGALAIDVPALAAKAAFEARLDTGERAIAMTLVDGLDGFERTALSWQGRAGVALHAFENGADYDTEGHIDAAGPASPARALSGKGGFLTVLGAGDMPGAQMAEVYSYPTKAGGAVDINVEAEVTPANCGREVSATVLTSSTRSLAPQPLSVTMPGCDAVGEFLVFSGLLPEIRLAAAQQ